jgi:hypothetical protein
MMQASFLRCFQAIGKSAGKLRFCFIAADVDIFVSIGAECGSWLWRFSPKPNGVKPKSQKALRLQCSKAARL